MSRVTRTALVLLVLAPSRGFAQTADPYVPLPQHDHAAMASRSWQFSSEGVAFLTVNHQGGSRGGDEVVSQNWWMGMLARRVGRGTLTGHLMFSLDPATVGADGYREIFQAGEAFHHVAIIDRQHPHEFLMQASVAWTVPIGREYTLTVSGGPVAEPALGPVPYMHRASAADNPTAPLSHHTLDSTHISMGVITGGIARGPWQAEGSVFRGREPDDERWDLMDPGALDSWSVRGWYKPNPQWAFQISTGFLNEPEELQAGDVRRLTASASWTRPHASGSTATTFAYGRNYDEGADFTALLAESTHTFGRNATYGRIEALQVETDLLRFGIHGFVGGKKRHVPDDVGRVDVVGALTLGQVRTLSRWRGLDLAVGGDATVYRVPSVLNPIYGDRPLSFHVFLRLKE